MECLSTEVSGANTQMNFYKPIQHTLNKLARSTNNTETSEFKEYITREGFTFEQVFGADGTGKSNCLLSQNKHNTLITTTVEAM